MSTGEGFPTGHTVLEYINNLSTQRLAQFLEQFYADAFEEDFSNYVPYIEYVLERRKRDNQS